MLNSQYSCLESQILHRLYRPGLAGRTAIYKNTAVLPLALPATSGGPLPNSQYKVHISYFISGSTGWPLPVEPVLRDSLLFWSRWVRAGGSTGNPPVEPALRGNLPTARFEESYLKGVFFLLGLQLFPLSLLHCYPLKSLLFLPIPPMILAYS